MGLALRGPERPDEPRGADRRGPLVVLLHGPVRGAGEGRDPPERIDTRADVTLDPSAGAITGIKLTVRAVVPGLSEDDFVQAAEGAKANCPVSKALAGTDITLEARLG